MDSSITPDTRMSSPQLELDSLNWLSPYQDDRFLEAARSTGFNTEKIDLSDGSLRFFSYPGEQLTAWEVDDTVAITEPIPDKYRVYQRTRNPTVESDTYSTIALSQNAPRFSQRFLRNTKKAELILSDEAFKELDISDLALVTAEFQEPERRDNLDPATFNSFVHNLAEVGLLRCFILDTPQTDGFCAASLVIANDHQANLRFYTANREINGTGHLLQKKVINHLFKDGLKIVDQSGYTPNTTDQKLQGINDFKQQIGGSIVTFKKHGL